MMNMMKAGAKGEKIKSWLVAKRKQKKLLNKAWLKVMTLYQALMQVWAINA